MENKFLSKSVPRGTRTIWRYLGALFILFTFAIGNVWAELTAHTPGTYEKATGEGGYGLTMVSYDPDGAGDSPAKNYEVYYFSWKSSKLYLAAGKSYVTDNTAYCLISNSGTSTTDGIDFGWGNVKCESLSGSNTSPAAEWAVPASNSSTHYVSLTNSTSLTLKVSGYDQFSFAGRDNHASTAGKQFVVTIDGEAQTFTHSATDWTVYRFDLTTGEHTIVVTGNGTDANRLRCFSLRVPSCDDANASIIANQSIYVNDELDLEFSSDNVNTVSYSIKKGGSATSDASVTDGVFKATVAGTYVVTATQAADASNHCAVEESVTITVNAKTPVASVSISGDATAFIGIAKTLTASADQAVSEYKWEVDGVDQGVNAATFNFSAPAAGTYSVVCKARNSFNDPGEYISSSAHSITVTKLCGELIKATMSSSSNKDAEITGILTGTKDLNISSTNVTYDSKKGYKLGGDDQYLGITGLSGTLQAGDTAIIYVTQVSTKLQLFSDKGSTLIGEMNSGVVQGENKIILNASATGKSAIYLYRTSTTGSAMNPHVYSLAVKRSCAISDDCSIKSLTINGEAITPVSKVYSYEVAAASALTEVAVAYTIHPLASGSPASGFNVTVPAAGDPANTQTITVTAEDGTTSDTYTVSVTKAAAASDVVTLDALGVTGYTLDPAFDAGTLAYTITKAYGAEDPGTDKVTYTKTETEQTVDVAYDGTNHKLTVTVTAEDNTTTQDYVITINEAEAPKSLSRVLFSNGFDAFIDNTNHTVKAYYLAGQAAPTATTITAGAGTAGEYAEGKITVTGADASHVDYIVTLEAVTPNTTTVAEAAEAGEFAGNEAWVKNGLLIYGNTDGFDNTGKYYVNRRLIKNTDPEDDQRVIAGWVRSYFFVGNASKFIMTVGGNKKLKYSVDGGEAVAVEPTTLEIALSKGNHMIEIVSNQSSGNCQLSAPKLVELPPTYTVTYAANGGSGTMTDANEYEAGDEVTLLENTFTPASGYIWSGWVATYNDGVEEQTLTITAGKFTMPAYAVTVTAQWDDVSKVAKIVETDVKYATFAEAAAAVADGETIQLLQDCDYDATWTITGMAVTLDLNGKNLTGPASGDAVAITTDGVLTIMDGTATVDPSINGSNEITYAAGKFTGEWLINVYAGGSFVMNSGWLLAGEAAAWVTNSGIVTVNNGVLEALTNAVVMGPGNAGKGGYTMNIHGGILLGHMSASGIANGYSSMAVYHPNTGTLNIDGGTLISENGPGVVVRGGASNITGGTIIAQGNGGGKCGDASAPLIGEVGVAYDFKANYPGVSSVAATISGTANVSGEDGAVQAIYAATEPTATEEAAVAISGGTFNTPVDNALCAENYIPKDNGDGTYGVKPKDGVAIISIAVPNGTGNAQTIAADNISGVIGGTATQKLQSGNTKLGSNGHYIGFTLANSETLKAGDVIRLNVSATNDATHLTLYQDASDANLVKDIEWAAATGVNLIPVPAEAVGLGTLYIYRKSSACNPSLSEFAILRPMQPMLTAFSVNGRDGVIDEVNKTVAVNIPFEADLDNLTIVDEVVWNEAAASDAKVVTTNSGAWVEDPATNTYRLTDKDGDYTDYIITLTRDVLKHTVSYNVHGGSAVASEEVEHNAYLAAAPAEPTKEDYIFQYWSLTEDGAEVDVTTVQIDEDKEFHAVWASDGAIKLLDGEGNINTTNFITGVTATTVTINEVEHKAAAWGGTQGAISGTNQLGKIVQYNATTNRTKIKVSVYNTNNSPKQVYLHKILEGETTAVVETLAVASKGNAPVESEYYEFNSDANRSFYLTTNSTDVKIVQVKVIESGDVTLKRAGEAGYELNLNKGRVLAYANTDINFEGLAFTASSNYGVISSSELQIKAPLSFTISSPVTLTLNNNSNKYQVSQSISGSGDEYAAGEQVLDLTTTGTWYIVPTTTSAVKLTSIAFALPKCEAPVFENTLADIELCATEAIPAIDGTATVSDGGDVTYKWYEEGSETVLATTATYTPAADGSYFVVATNSLAGHQDVSTTSDVVKVSHFASVAITTAPEDVYKHAGLDAELSVVAEGKNVTYEWFTCDDELGTNPVAIVPAQTGASLNLTAIEAGIKYYQVVVTDECGTTASAVAKVEGFNDIALQDVTGDMTWDFSKDGLADQATVGTDVVMVNVAGVVNNDDFHSDNIMVTANKQAGTKLQASMIKFHTTVNGLVKVIFSNTGTKTSERYLVVNGQKTASGSKNSTAVTYYGFVPAGDVELTVVDGDGNMLNFTSVKFIAKAAPDYVRDDSWMAPGELGTFCIPQGAVAVGAEMYEFMGRNPENGKIAFDNVEHMEPGKPYLFRSNSYQIDFYYTDEAEASEPDNSSAMKGSFTNGTIYDNLANVYYFNGTALWSCANLSEFNYLANRAYVMMDEVTDLSDPAPAPGRRRVTMGVNGEKVATGMDDVQGDQVQSIKVLIDGQLYILRGEKMFDATGRLVK